MSCSAPVRRNLFTALVAACACDIDVNDDDRDDETETPVAFTPDSDVALIDALVPHHEAALEMAQEIVQRGTDPELREMAQTMIAAQRSEIERMSRARQELTGKPSQARLARSA